MKVSWVEFIEVWKELFYLSKSRLLNPELERNGKIPIFQPTKIYELNDREDKRLANIIYLPVLLIGLGVLLGVLVFGDSG